MPDIFTAPVMRAAIGVVVLCILITIAFYLVASFRDYVADDQEQGSEPLANLREMHRKGVISDEEFRTIHASTHRLSAGSMTADELTSSDDSSPNKQA